MNYHDWLAETPIEIVNDPLWNIELYRLALFMGELAWYDSVKLSLKPPTVTIASQLYQSAGNISAHVARAIARPHPMSKPNSITMPLAMREPPEIGTSKPKWCWAQQ